MYPAPPVTKMFTVLHPHLFHSGADLCFLLLGFTLRLTAQRRDCANGYAFGAFRQEEDLL